MINTIKRMIPERIKGPVLARFRPRHDPELAPWRGRKKVVVTLAGFYQNLGDMALTYAQRRFIEQTLPDHEVLLFASTDTYSRMRALKAVVGPEDIITTIGGGNMDDIYPSLENARRFVIRSFPRNPVISFPQTIAFSSTPEGSRARARSARTYRAHRRLVVFAREPRSRELMQAGLRGTRIGYSPDIVLSIPPTDSSAARAGVLLAVRQDREVALTAVDRSEIMRVIESRTDDIVVRDTIDVSLDECRPEAFAHTLHGFWDLLRTRRVVVTDRLHAMIFCVITRTPVVVLPNSNHKISGTYRAWLQGYPHIRYLDVFDASTLAAALDEMWDLPSADVRGPDLSPHYEELRQALREAAGSASRERGASGDGIG